MTALLIVGGLVAWGVAGTIVALRFASAMSTETLSQPSPFHSRFDRGRVLRISRLKIDETEEL